MYATAEACRRCVSAADFNLARSPRVASLGDRRANDTDQIYMYVDTYHRKKYFKNRAAVTIISAGRNFNRMCLENLPSNFSEEKTFGYMVE